MVFLGCDVSIELLKIASANAATSTDYTLASGLNLPYRNGTFDSAICIAVIHHVSSPRRFLEEVLRTVKVGGQVLFTVWAFEQEKKSKNGKI
jgi:ubiquinone/menaquinone biosynthesis C-methylase UbiE